MLTVPKALSRGYCARGQIGRFSGTSCQSPAPRNKHHMQGPNLAGNSNTTKQRQRSETG